MGWLELRGQIVILLVLAMPVACIAWTVTHEDIFRECRHWCTARGRASRRLLPRKFYYVFTCEYCFSHYVAALAIAVTRFHLAYPGWLGLAVAFFSVIWIANLYISLFARLRLEIKEERLDVEAAEVRNER